MAKQSRGFGRRFGGNSKSNKYSTAGVYRRSHVVDKDMTTVESNKSISEYQKANRLLMNTSSHMLNVFPQEKLDILNRTTYHSIKKGLTEALQQLSKGLLCKPTSPYGISEDIYDSEILPLYQKIEVTLENLNEVDISTFSAQTYFTTLNNLISDLEKSKSVHVKNSIIYLRTSFSEGVLGFYEKEGLSNPQNIFDFFTNLGLTTSINDLLEGVDLDPTNHEHHTLLLLAYEMYHDKFDDYTANRTEFINDLKLALNSYGNNYVEADSDAAKSNNALYEIVDKVLKREGDENFADNVIKFGVLEKSMENTASSNLHLTPAANNSQYDYHDEYRAKLKEATDTIDRFNEIEAVITATVNTLSSYNTNPKVDIADFIDPSPKTFTYKGLKQDRSGDEDKSLSYPNFKFSSIEQFNNIIKGLKLNNMPGPSVNKFQSVDCMTASLARFAAKNDFTRAGVLNPSEKALDLMTTSKVTKLSLRTKFRSSIEDFGARSQGLENLNLPRKILSYDLALNFAMQNVLRRHPDIDSGLFRNACKAKTVEEIDRLLRESKRIISPEVISLLVANLHSIYAGHMKSLDENGNECILAIQEDSFVDLQKQIGYITSAYSNYFSTQVDANMPKGLSDSEKRLRLTQEYRLQNERIMETAAVLSVEGVGMPDTLMHIKNSTRSHVKRMISKGVSYDKAVEIARKNGFEMGTYGYYSKHGYMARRVVSSTSNFASKWVLKPVSQAFGKFTGLFKRKK